MRRVSCQRCGHVLASPRGDDRVRFVRLPILVVSVAEDGAQSLGTVCPRCRGDVAIPLPLPDSVFRSRREPQGALAAAIDTSRLDKIASRTDAAAG